jgi:hypothetical protein
MKPMIITVAALALIATMAACSGLAVAKSAKGNGTPPRDRYFDAAHGPNDPHSVWSAGDYIDRDPDLTIRAAMLREQHD